MLFEFRTERKIIDIPIVKIRPCRFQLREDYPAEQIKQLADSIEQNGILQPVLVRKISRDEYELVAGERRLRAAICCGMKKIPCIVRRISDRQAGIDALEENIQRTGVNCFKEAELIQELIYKYGEENSANKSERLKLLEFTEEEKEIFNKYGFTIQHVQSLLKIKDTITRRFIISEIIEEGLNVTQTEKYIEDTILAKKQDRLSRQKTKLIIKNIKIFENTINKAVDVIKSSGLRAGTEKRETEDYYEYTVRIPKSVFDNDAAKSRTA